MSCGHVHTYTRIYIIIATTNHHHQHHRMSAYACMRACARVHACSVRATRTCVHTRARTHARICTHTHARTHTHAHTRAHTHTHIHTCRETEGVKEADPIGTCAHKSCVCIYTRARACTHAHPHRLWTVLCGPVLASFLDQGVPHGTAGHRERPLLLRQGMCTYACMSVCMHDACTHTHIHARTRPWQRARPIQRS